MPGNQSELQIAYEDYTVTMINPPTSSNLASPRADHETNEELMSRYTRTREITMRNELALRHQRLVTYAARRFAPVGATSFEDLIQVGYIGLLRALESYDPSHGTQFAAYALPTIAGVIKHYLRDHTWSIKVPRRLGELTGKLRRRQAAMEQELGRLPTVMELAEGMGVSEEDVVMTQEVDLLYHSTSLESLAHRLETDFGAGLSVQLGAPDPEMEHIVRRDAVRQAIDCLDERQRLIIRRRYLGEATQTEVARELGISQMHVSRLERRALERLRELLD